MRAESSCCSIDAPPDRSSLNGSAASLLPELSGRYNPFFVSYWYSFKVVVLRKMEVAGSKTYPAAASENTPLCASHVNDDSGMAGSTTGGLVLAALSDAAASFFSVLMSFSRAELRESDTAGVLTARPAPAWPAGVLIGAMRIVPACRAILPALPAASRQARKRPAQVR